MKIKKTALFLLLAMAPVFAMAQCEILIWQDNFDGTEINREIWNVLDDNSGGGNAELQYYTSRPSNVYIENGNLVLKAIKENYEGKIFTSGKVTTKGIVDWKYGRIEARMRLPEGQGIWPAFWMLSSDNVYGEWPNSGEIDIMELIGQEPSNVYGTLHFGPPWNYTNGIYTLSSGKFSDDFHTFAIDWAEDSIKWYVDGFMYSKKTVADVDQPFQWNAFKERFYVILNLAVGGNWPGSPDATTVFPQTMEIDYVRVYGDPTKQDIRALDKAYPNARHVRYTFTDMPGATFTWSVPAGATIIGGEGTHAISVDWGCDPGTITLDVTNIGCDDQHYELPVSFSELTVAGPSELFPLEDGVYSLPEMSGTSYTWQYPADAVPDGTPDDSLLIKWGCDAGYVKVSISNNCFSDRDSMAVALTEPLFTGPSNVSQYAAGMVYNISLQPDASYNWSVPEGAVIAEGQGTNSIKVDFADLGGDITVVVTNTCGEKTYTIPLNISDTIIVANFETTFLDFLTFSETTFTVAANPAKDEVNSSEYVGESFKSVVTWAGIYADLGYNLRFVKHDKFSMKVYGPKTGNVLFKIEDIVEKVGSPIEISAPLTKVNEWEELTFEFPTAADETYDRIAVFFDFGSAEENTYYFDDIFLLPKESTESARGEEDLKTEVWPNPFSDFIMVSTPPAAGEYTLSVFDMQGRLLYKEAGNDGNGEKRFGLEGLENGIYLLNIQSSKELYSTLIRKE
ncbi:MAG: family 16 glycosylhydrolase [Bacteroidota bacterium]